MPELPEVETIVRSLKSVMEGEKISCFILRTLHLRYPIDRSLPFTLPDKVIKMIRRRAKYIIIELENDLNLIIHLGLTGRLILNTDSTNLSHFSIVLKNGTSLTLFDPRRFSMLLTIRGEPEKHRFLSNLGPEPLSADFDDESFYEITGKTRATIKSLLMSGRHVVGLGNIYCSEVLFYSQILPMRPSSDLSRAEIRTLTKTIKKILADAIVNRGCSMRDYYDPNGNIGNYQNKLAVYGRSGRLCKICQSFIQQKKQHNRSTFYCPNCQR